ncbi:MAG TPA: hypothetical protein VL494_13385 [Steroidobacteraceae bacterium]|jgi:hypothetical protein|nr:hypothetical protein [Steroidobacteraceae bacterium]
MRPAHIVGAERFGRPSNKPRTSGTLTARRRWERACRELCDLTPAQLAFLLAVVLHETLHHCCVSIGRMQELSAQQEQGERFDTNSTPSELYQLGLIERLGTIKDRRYTPTAAGVRRVGRALVLVDAVGAEAAE